jgi:hypothetical protein
MNAIDEPFSRHIALDHAADKKTQFGNEGGGMKQTTLSTRRGRAVCAPKRTFQKPHERDPRWLHARVLIAGLLFAVMGGSAFGQGSTQSAGGPYLMLKQAIAAGGNRATGGSYTLTGTVAQATLDPIPASAASYQLEGGFHTRGSSSSDLIFANDFEQ